ncbi:UNKNOWN [Stylonychia lemnae]|uniref:Tim10-like domain-containing protein n=1 Tax=Stylonychia lemnae TaxID=5949 RepID=A0A078B0L9_STYLE|nr:UNKNOWN [Stylonychia lemnae]|eukprot:CDW88084.1 UNKNOWN [Stylonychia lemnae]
MFNQSIPTFEPFKYKADRFHSFIIKNQNDLVQTVFKLEYIKKQEANTILACSRECFANWRQDDLSRAEKDCLHSCFTKLTTVSDIFYVKSGLAATQRYQETQKQRRQQEQEYLSQLNNELNQDKIATEGDVVQTQQSVQIEQPQEAQTEKVVQNIESASNNIISNIATDTNSTSESN